MENKQLRIGCVVMAAGNARRFGENKLAAVFQGKSLLQRALEAVPSEKLGPVAVVVVAQGQQGVRPRPVGLHQGRHRLPPQQGLV